MSNSTDAPVSKAQFGPRPNHQKRNHVPQVNVAESSGRYKVSAGATARFLRSLATMIGAGVSFLRALELLSDQSEEEAVSSISLELSADLRGGHRLSHAFSRHPRVFSPLLVQMVKMGEDSGSLARVLNELARYEENRYGLVQKLRSRLVYPAFLLVASLTMAIVGPPYLLGNILELLNSYQVQLSPLTRAIMVLSEASTNPLVWFFLALVGCVLWFSGRRLVKLPEVRIRLVYLASAIPYIGAIIEKLTLTRVASALALQLRSGTPLLKSLEVALALSGNPLLQTRSQAVQQALKDGETVVAALEQAGYFPGYFLAMVEVGVSSGNLDGSMAWLAEFCEQEFERELESMTAVVEPFVMLIMGIIVALMLVGTMLPFVQLLQSL